jgi:hypothetical protein
LITKPMQMQHGWNVLKQKYLKTWVLLTHIRIAPVFMTRISDRSHERHN